MSATDWSRYVCDARLRESVNVGASASHMALSSARSTREIFPVNTVVSLPSSPKSILRVAPSAGALNLLSAHTQAQAFFCAPPAPTEIYTLSLHDALPI